MDCVEDLLVQNESHINGQTAQIKIKYDPNTMSVYPVTEDELNHAISKLKGNSATGFDQIPEFLVKGCIQYIKKLLISILNVSINQGNI
jgi:Cu/Ag efflux pump CusA